MEKILFKDLAESEKKLDTILHTLDIPIKSCDRIHKAFSIVRELGEVHSEPVALGKMITAHGELTVSSSLHDINMIHKILDHCESVPKKILKQKLVRILKGSLFHEEDKKTADSRNTLFELTLYSSFKEAGYEVSLCEQNPDILLCINGQDYNIQCKRIFTDTPGSVYTNVKDAMSQLKKDIERNHSSYGIIAISVEEILAKKQILDSTSPQKGLDFVKKQVETFIEEYSSKVWMNKSLTSRYKKILAIIVHMNTIAIMRDEGLQSNVAQFTISNVVDKDDTDFKTLQDGLTNLLKSVNR